MSGYRIGQLQPLIDKVVKIYHKLMEKLGGGQDEIYGKVIVFYIVTRICGQDALEKKWRSVYIHAVNRVGYCHRNFREVFFRKIYENGKPLVKLDENSKEVKKTLDTIKRPLEEILEEESLGSQEDNNNDSSVASYTNSF